MRLTKTMRSTLTKAQASRYRASNYQQKRRILDEFVVTTGYNRKYASHLLSRWGLSSYVELDGEFLKLTAGRPKTAVRVGNRRYDKRIDEALCKLWNLFDCMCGKRLVVAIDEHLGQVAGRLGIAAELHPLLRTMSPATIDRHLAAERARDPLRGLCHTRPTNGLMNLIPIRTSSDWKDSSPGFFQADTVGHDGGSSYGEFCFTLTLVDVCSQWTELRALLNKAKKWVRDGLHDIRQTLAFPLLGINSDSGSEFINQTIYEFCTPAIRFTRSRPNKKNDNCFVECKNDTAVRQHVGYARFSGEQARDALTEVYRYLCPLMNHVYPSMKLIEKRRNGSKVYRRHDTPKTPYRRLINDSRLSAEAKKTLAFEHDHIDIVELTLGLQNALAKLGALATHSPRRSLEPGVSALQGVRKRR